MNRIGDESSNCHRCLNPRVIAQRSRVDGKIAVLGRFRQGHLSTAGPEIYGLCTDDDDCVAVLG